MLNYKLIEILKSFTKSEFHDLEKFSKAAYFNKGRNYLPLIRTLKRYYPDFNKAGLTKDIIFHKIFPGRKYNDQVLRNLMSGLEKICEQFIVFNRIKENETDFNLILSAAFKNRTLLNLSGKYAGKCLQSLSKAEIDKEYYRKLYNIYQLKKEISQEMNDPFSAFQNLSHEAANLFYLFLMETNNHIEEMMVLNYNSKVNLNDQLPFNLPCFINFDGIINFLKQNNNDNVEIAELFAAHIKMLTDYRNEDNFDKFYLLFNKNIDKLGRWGKYYMFISLENACIRLKSVNGKKYHYILINLYKEQLKHDAFTQTEKSPFAVDLFRNIVIDSLSIKELEWAETFIYKYIEKVSPDNRENMFNFSLSLVYFEKKNFEESLSCLAKLKYDSFVYKLDVKVLSLMIYYELGYLEEALSVIDSFKHFMKKTKSISGYVKEIHSNFLKYYYETIKLKSSINVKENEKKVLIDKISKLSIRNKRWLFEKIDLI